MKLSTLECGLDAVLEMQFVSSRIELEAQRLGRCKIIPAPQFKFGLSADVLAVCGAFDLAAALGVDVELQLQAGGSLLCGTCRSAAFNQAENSS
ncbi:MAG: hypothetical protein ACO2PM_09520 [Pyrobaculum sp.]